MKAKTMASALAAIFLAGLARAGSEGTNQPPQELRLELDLADGSHIIGIPKIDAVSMQTAYTKLALPLRYIRAVKIAEDHETATFNMRNGDKLSGIISLEPVGLETIFGRVSIAAEHIRKVDVLLAGSALPESLRKGLLLHYSFGRDCGARIMDESGNGHEGTVKAPVWTAEGKQGGAYVFDGKDDRIDVSGWQPTTGKEPFSTAAWFKTTGGGSSREYRVLAWGVHRSWGGAEAGIAYQEKYFQFTTFGDGTTYLRGKANVCDNEWHSFVGTYDGAVGSLYIDGQFQERKDWSPVAIGTGDLGIAHRPPVGGSFWGGSIDEVMIYNRALTEEEVKELYEAQK